MEEGREWGAVVHMMCELPSASHGDVSRGSCIWESAAERETQAGDTKSCQDIHTHTHTNILLRASCCVHTAWHLITSLSSLGL